MLTMKQMLEAGVHFGHQTKRWNPKMKPYIFGARNGIYIIDLQKTVELYKGAHQAVVQAVANGGKVMFVGTKKQAADTIAEEADRSGQLYVNNRWLGGTLTNFITIRKSIDRFKNLEEMKEKGNWGAVTKKEQLKLEKELVKMEKSFGGLKNMEGLPTVLFIIDPRKERIAVHEANKLGIPVVAVTDTNCDPDPVDYVIPSNDDAIRAIKLFAGGIAEAVIEGKQVFEENIRHRHVKEEPKPRKPVKEKPEVAAPEEEEAAPPSGVSIEVKKSRRRSSSRKTKPSATELAQELSDLGDEGQDKEAAVRLEESAGAVEAEQPTTKED